MKLTSKVALFVSCGCFLGGAGGIAMPQVKNALAMASPPPKSIPRATVVAKPDTSAPRFRVIELTSAQPSTRLQPLAFNNAGEVLCITEERRREMAGRPGSNPLNRESSSVRPIQLYVYRNGDWHPVRELAPSPTAVYRFVAFNDRGEILAYKFTAPPQGEKNQMPQLVIWSNGTIKDPGIMPSLMKMGLSNRTLPFLDTGSLSFNNKGQIVVALQNLYLWDNGKVQQLGRWNIQSGERVLLNNSGTVIRRSDQIRASADGQTVYPLLAIFSAGQTNPETKDLGENIYVFELNNDNSLLVGRAFVQSGEIVRTEVAAQREGTLRPMFVLDGRTMARGNARGEAISWRLGSPSVWEVLVGNRDPARTVPSVPVFWDGTRLYDLASLLPPDAGLQIISVYDINDRGEILIQARRQNKVNTYVLRPETGAQNGLQQARS